MFVPERGKVQGNGVKCTVKSFMIVTPFRLYLSYRSKNKLGRHVARMGERRDSYRVVVAETIGKHMRKTWVQIR
jgi:hypothetical protein